MIKGKKQILLLSILGVTTLLVAIIGATYAYFTTSMTGRNGTINTTTAKIGAASFTAESVSVDKVLPGWTSGEKNVTVTLEPSDYDVKYTCTLKMTANPLTDLTLTVQGTNALTSVNGKLKSGASDTIIASGTLKASQTKQSISMTYTLSFPETGVDQNTQQGKTITGLVTCSTEGQTIYYNSENPNGTTTKPTGTNSISLQEAILRDNPTISERTNFSTAFTEETTGTIYQTNKTEDGSTVYYYAGNTTNNWVKFGKYDEHDLSSDDKLYYRGEDIYWRIIRTNEDGSIRLLYAGNSPESTTPYIAAYLGDATSDAFGHSGSYSEDILDENAMNARLYVGYMYGTTGTLENNRTNENSSLIKKSLDDWFAVELMRRRSEINNKTYSTWVSEDAIYCNDRSIADEYDEITEYGPSHRGDNPSYKCGANTSNGLFESTQSISDKFNSSGNNGGNGKLKHYADSTYSTPLALMTADEAIFAGISADSGENVWINKNSSSSINIDFATMSPDFSDDSYPLIYVINYSGELTSRVSDSDIKVRPVLSLKSCVNVTGTGTPDDPYVVDYDNSCS